MVVHLGDTEVFSISIRDDDDLLEDPTSLTLRVTTPAAVDTTYTYGVSAALVRDGVGRYHLNQVVNQIGTWRWRWTGVGVVDFVLDGSVVVHPLPVPVTIHVQNAVATSVQGAVVTVLNDLSVVASGTTDASGNVTLLLEPLIAYTVEVSKGNSIVPYQGSMTPANTPSQSFTFSVTSLTLSPPTPPRTVWLYGWTQQMGGSKTGDQTVIVETIGYKAKSIEAGSRTMGQRRELRSDAGGVWGCAVHAGSKVKVTIPSARAQTVFTVPDDAAVTTLNFADVRPDPGPGGEVGVTADVPTFDSLKGVS